MKKLCKIEISLTDRGRQSSTGIIQARDFDRYTSSLASFQNPFSGLKECKGRTREEVAY
jgi:hypothetical protein